MFKKSLTISGVSLILLLLLLGWFSSLSASSGVNNNDAAKVPPAEADAPAIAQISPDELEPSTRSGNTQVSTETGQPLALFAVNYAVAPGTPEEMARQYLAANATLLHLQSADLSDLEHTFTRQGPSGPTVRFQQVLNGIPVYKSEVVVHLNNEHTVTYVINDYKSMLDSSAIGAPALTAVAATESVRDYLGITGKTQVETTELMLYVLQGQTYLVYRVNIVTNNPLGDWEAMVDANSGEFLKLVNQSMDYGPEGEGGSIVPTLLVTGTGNVFDPDPLSSANATYGDTGFTDNNDATSAQLDAELMSVPLKDIAFTGGMYHLDGPYAAIRDTESPFFGLFSQASSDWNYNRFDNAFEAANTYYHIDSSMRYLNETLGLNIMPYQYSGGVRFDPHGLNGADNSHYSTGSGQVAFGEGGVDDAEDSDVIHHELGHGLHDWVTNGGLSQVNGLSEGSGDYWAQSYNRSLGYWQPSDPPYQWVFNWDGHNPFWPGRVTNYPALYPGGLTGQIHTDGQIWSTCNMRVYDAIGQQQMDRAFWEGLGMTTSSTNQEVAANAVYQAAIDMGYSNAELQDMHDIYLTCVYVVPDVPSGAGVALSPDQAAIGMPGSPVTYTVGITNTGDMADTFDLTVSGNTWTTIPSTSSVTLNAAESAIISVVVSIPGNAGNGDTDTATVTATSQIDPSVNDSTDLTTTAITQSPVIEVNPSSLDSTQVADSTVTQTLTISNTGTLDLLWSITEVDGSSLLGGSSSWADNFDSYVTGSQMHGQGGWKGWDNAPAAGALTSATQARSAPNSVNITAGSDLVHEYTDYTSGQWTYSTWQYIPTGYTGQSYFILLNTYADGGPNNWSTQVCFDAGTGMLNDDIPGSCSGTDTLPIVYDQWVQIRVEIDLNADTQTFYYNNQMLYQDTWTGHVSGGGALNIGAVDLYANGASPVYYDDFFLTPAVASACDAPSDIPWASVLTVSGTTVVGAASTVDVAFDSIGLATGVYTGTLCVNSNDPVTPLVETPVMLTVVEPSVYGVDVTAVEDAITSTVGTTVTYSVHISNTGDVTDSFTITATGNTWTTNLSAANITLGTGAGEMVTVTVQIPAGAADGAMDTVTITAVSDTDVVAIDSVDLTTTAVATGPPSYIIYLPIILKP